MISDQEMARYQRDGYIVVPDVLSAQDVASPRRVTDEFVELSRKSTEHTDVFDLEPGHTSAQPRLRRIKSPHLHHPDYARLVGHPGIVAILRKLWGPNVRFDLSKLNQCPFAGSIGGPARASGDRWICLPERGAGPGAGGRRPPRGVRAAAGGGRSIAAPASAAIASGTSRRDELVADRGSFWKSVSEGPRLRALSHGGAITRIMTILLAAPARPHDYMFLRVGAPGRATGLHYDYPFFTRAHDQLCTVWLPIGDVPVTDGPLVVVEGSNRYQDLIEPMIGFDVAATAPARPRWRRMR